MLDYIKLIRVKQWIKNVLIFLPLFFGRSFLSSDKLFITFLAFLAFCFSASIVYVVNDISDKEKDQKHPIKKNRPIAAGKISIFKAWAIVIVLFILSIILYFIIHQYVDNIFVFLIPIMYIFINILYSKWLKNIPVIDVIVIVVGFVLRIMYGGICTGILISKYLYLMVIFGSFYLGFGKRRNEIIQNGDKSRYALKLYNKDFLDKNMYVAFSLAVVSYSLWCTSSDTIARIGNDYLFWTIPLVLVIFQLYSLNIEGDSYGDPTDVILSDKILLLFIIIYVIVMVLLLYVI